MADNETMSAMLDQIFNDFITKILSTETEVFLKQIVFLKSFNSLLSGFFKLFWKGKKPVL